MFTHLRIKNFKAWRDTGDIRLAPLTVFFGANSAGKSNLTQFLLALKQTVESPDRQRVLHSGDGKTVVDLGSRTHYTLISPREHVDRDILQTELRLEGGKRGGEGGKPDAQGGKCTLPDLPPELTCAWPQAWIEKRLRSFRKTRSALAGAACPWRSGATGPPCRSWRRRPSW